MATMVADESLKPATKVTSAGWYALFLVSSAQGLSLLDRQILSILAPSIKADLGFSRKNGRHLLFSKQANGGKITMRVPASKADFQIDEGAFPSYTLIIKAKLGGGHVETTKVEFKRC